MSGWAGVKARAKAEISRIAYEAIKIVVKVKTTDILDLITPYKRLWQISLTLLPNIDVNILLNLSEHR